METAEIRGMRWSLGLCVTGPRLSWPDDERHTANAPRHQSLRAPFTALLADGKDLIRGGNLPGEKNVFLSGGDSETVGCRQQLRLCLGFLHRPPGTAQQAAGGTLEHDDAGSIGLVVVMGNWNWEAGAWYTRTVWERTRV